MNHRRLDWQFSSIVNRQSSIVNRDESSAQLHSRFWKADRPRPGLRSRIESDFRPQRGGKVNTQALSLKPALRTTTPQPEKPAPIGRLGGTFQAVARFTIRRGSLV